MRNLRQNNFEVLRVLSIFLIIASHCFYFGIKQHPVHQNLSVEGLAGMLNYLTAEGLYLLAGIGVNCFVMISGYFMINRPQMRYKGIMHVWLLTSFYSIIGYIVMTAVSGESVRFIGIVDYIEPIHSNKYWFVSQYIGMALIAPFIAKGVVSLQKREYLALLMVLFILFFEVPWGGGIL